MLSQQHRSFINDFSNLYNLPMKRQVIAETPSGIEDQQVQSLKQRIQMQLQKEADKKDEVELLVQQRVQMIREKEKGDQIKIQEMLSNSGQLNQPRNSMQDDYPE